MVFAPLFFGGGGEGEGVIPVLGQRIVGRSALGDVSLKSFPTPNLTATTISIVFEDYQGGNDIAVIADANITKTSTSISFNVPVAVAARTQFLRISVRSNTAQLLQGTWWVRKAALED